MQLQTRPRIAQTELCHHEIATSAADGRLSMCFKCMFPCLTLQLLTIEDSNIKSSTIRFDSFQVSGPTGQIGAVVLRRVAVVRRSVLVLSRGKQTKEVPNAKETPLKSEIATARRHVKLRVQSEKRIGIDWLYATNGMRCKVATVAWLCMA